MAFESIVQGGGVLTQGFGQTAYALSCRCEWTCPGYAPGAFHAGIDVAHSGSPFLLAVGYGQVVRVGRTMPGPCSGLGPYAVCVRSGPVDIWYGHAQKALVGVGTFVKPKQPIAIMGSVGCSTGTHVHYEVLPAGMDPNGCAAFDPWAYVSRWPGSPVTAPPPAKAPRPSKAPWLVLAAGAGLLYAAKRTV